MTDLLFGGRERERGKSEKEKGIEGGREERERE